MSNNNTFNNLDLVLNKNNGIDQQINIKTSTTGIEMKYDISTGNPKTFSIRPTGINYTDNTNNNTTALDRLSLVQQAFQAVVVPQNSTTLQINDTILLSDGITSNSIDKNKWTGNIQTVNTSTNATQYLNFSDSSVTGYGKPLKTSGINCNPSTNTITATTFVGDLQGNSDTATNVGITDTNISANFYPVYTDGAGTGKTLRADVTSTPWTVNPNNGDFRFNTLKLDGVNYNIGVGYNAGISTQSANAVAVGNGAGQLNQKTNTVAIGYNAGNVGQGANSVAIGSFAGQTNQVANSIAINASSIALNPTNVGCYIRPIRGVAHGIGIGIIKYDPATYEITYSTT